ncbi:MAG: hypothetical protein PHQ60_13935 [Sideroxydans sp.]|nr:hypothetical protein [Sideroxydans sp.]
MNNKAKIFKIVVMVVAGIVALGWVVMALWNWLLPNLFVGVHEISYVQALGVLVLSKILFGGFRGHGGMHKRMHHHHLKNMTAEEREKFLKGMGGCCGGKHKLDEAEAKE